MASEAKCVICDRPGAHVDVAGAASATCCGRYGCCAVTHWRIEPLDASPAGLDTTATRAVLDDVLAERSRQHAKWGRQDLPDGTVRDHDAVLRATEAQTRCAEAALLGTLTYRHIAEEEDAEAFAETDEARLEAELIQSIAVRVQWVEAIRRRRAKADVDAAVRAQLGGGR